LQESHFGRISKYASNNFFVGADTAFDIAATALAIVGTILCLPFSRRSCTMTDNYRRTILLEPE
jgi:hypothetical protein